MKQSDKKKGNDLLVRSLKKSSESFDSRGEMADIQEEDEIKDKLHTISKKCHDMPDRSLEIISEPAGKEKLGDIENCAIDFSEIRNWVESSIKDKILSSEIDDISDYVKCLEEMEDKMEFIDTIESYPPDTHKNLRKIMKKRFLENSD